MKTPTALRQPAADAPTFESFGSVPRIPIGTTLITPLKRDTSAPGSAAPQQLLTQIRARLAFERASTRLYEAFMTKLDSFPDIGPRSQRGAVNRDTLQRFRNEEAAHFELLCESLESMGADPFAELTAAGDHLPAAVEATVLASDRFDAAQALDVLIDAEQTDEAGWHNLVATAQAHGLEELAHRFEQAHSEEIGHVRQLRAWKAMLPTGRRVA